MSNPYAPERNSQPRQKGSSRLWIVLVMIALVVAGVGIFMRMEQASALKTATKEEAIPNVVVVKAPHAPASEEIVLPGNIQAWHEAPIYARTNGYLRDWVTDIGTRVKQGDLLATIEAPEVDAQLHQAEADLNTAQANNKIAQITAERWQNLLKTNSVSKQDAEDRVAAAAAAAATENAAEANVNHLRELVLFERIVAPFDGIITARNTDNGALINAGSSGTGPELFHIAETDKLRIYVQVPETYVDAVKPDLVAELQLAEHPGQTFPATLSHSADALDPATRTLLIELEADNQDGTLLPGGYAQVHIKMPAAGESVMLPVNVFLFRAQGMQVATIDENSKVVLKSVGIGRDYGNKLEVTSGVTPDEPIILNPPDSLATGQQVRVVSAGEKSAQDGDGGGKGAKKQSGDNKQDKQDNQDKDGKDK
jgi:RND family efflux transporter MFP subunit